MDPKEKQFSRSAVERAADVRVQMQKCFHFQFHYVF